MCGAGWLERGPGKDDRRGRDEFVAMEWDEVLDLLAKELARVRDTHGLNAIFGGSYGWASAGRFHHAQSQIHRFLNTALGGYVRSVNSYSAGASNVMLPHILGGYDDVTRRNVSWDEIVTHTDIVLAFGGMATKNSRIGQGGISEHTERNDMAKARARGTQFVLVSPQRTDLPAEAQAEWLAPVPGTDVAMMMGIAHTLVAANLHDRAFLDSHCTGWSVFEDYLMGRADGVAKTAAWASPLCGIAASEIEALARRLAGKRVLIVVSHSLQRSEHGEQPVWMGAVLASMLGQMGLPGGGYSYALGAVANYGKRSNAVPVAALPQGQNAVRDFIPVARLTDMLLNPGKPFDYNGERMTYPDIKLVYWAGGNPFHHHQDINRMRRAFFGIETLVVHEIAWTATARHADIVLPCTMTLEREDIGATPYDQLMLAMHRLAKPFGRSARRLRHLRRPRRAARQARGVHRGPQSPRLAAPHLRDDAEGARGQGPAGAGFRSVLARGRTRTAGPAGRRRYPACLPRRSGRQAAADAERQDRDLLEDHRRLRLRRLSGPSGLAAAVRCAGGRTRRCTSSPTSRRRACTASSISAATAMRRSIAAARS